MKGTHNILPINNNLIKKIYKYKQKKEKKIGKLIVNLILCYITANEKSNVGKIRSNLKGLK